jgi:ketosteroid isomerase-like protein
MLPQKSLFTASILVMSLNITAQTTKEQSIKEINAAENAFAKMAAEKGVQQAFVFYAAEDAVIKRGNDSLVRGKKGIGNFYAKDIFKRALVVWAPNFTDAAESGDLGYTFGDYTWQLKDESGKLIEERKGVFHTVWKKQKDGTWKYVWD